LAAAALRVLAAHGFRVFAAHGFKVFAAQGFRVLAAHGFRVFAAQGLMVLAAQGLMVFAAQGLSAGFWAGAVPAIPRVTTAAMATVLSMPRSIEIAPFLMTQKHASKHFYSRRHKQERRAKTAPTTPRETQWSRRIAPTDAPMGQVENLL
jgi:hypothetical protein